MQDRSTLYQRQPDESQSMPPQSDPPLLRRSRRWKCLSISLAVLTSISTLGILFFAVNSPYQFISFFNGLLNRMFQGPYWSSDSRSGWWYRLFIHERFNRDCKIQKADRYDTFNSSAWWNSGHAQPQNWSDHEIRLRTVPDYVLEFAPLIHLYSDEEFWPGDIAEHLIHTTPFVDYTPISDCDANYNLSNLNQLNRYGRYTYLHSNDNVEDRPKWLGGQKNIPVKPDGTVSSTQQDPESDAPMDDDFRSYADDAIRASYDIGGAQQQGAELHKRGRNIRTTSEESQTKRRGGRSDAPAFLIVVPKEDGIVDAFWFFFYSYNLGNKVLNIRFGDHVGDWEHTLVRFKDGKPDSLFFSEHFFGEAYSYQAVEKIGKRVSRFCFSDGTHC